MSGDDTFDDESTDLPFEEWHTPTTDDGTAAEPQESDDEAPDSGATDTDRGDISPIGPEPPRSTPDIEEAGPPVQSSDGVPVEHWDAPDDDGVDWSAQLAGLRRRMDGQSSGVGAPASRALSAVRGGFTRAQSALAALLGGHDGTTEGESSHRGVRDRVPVATRRAVLAAGSVAAGSLLVGTWLDHDGGGHAPDDDGEDAAPAFGYGGTPATETVTPASTAGDTGPETPVRRRATDTAARNTRDRVAGFAGQVTADATDVQGARTTEASADTGGNDDGSADAVTGADGTSARVTEPPFDSAAGGGAGGSSTGSGGGAGGSMTAAASSGETTAASGKNTRTATETAGTVQAATATTTASSETVEPFGQQGYGEQGYGGVPTE